MARADIMMRKVVKAGIGLVAVLIWAAPAAVAGSIDCSARGLSRAEGAVCADPQLSRTDEQLARRADGVARRMNYGQYLGLRHWQAASASQRDLCGADRVCITAQYRAEKRLLDRLQECLETRFVRRSCLRNAISGDREAVRR
jgi:uncharacterized protein